MTNQQLTPYDSTNSSNPYLINVNKNELISIDGNILSAEFIWSKSGIEREHLLNRVFKYYRDKGFPIIKSDKQSITKEFLSLKNTNTNTINIGQDTESINNSNSCGTNIIKHFCFNNFYSAKTFNKKSLIDIFNDDTLFLKVLKNRMGWNISLEDGTPRPYVFGINDKMILQGIRSSGLGCMTSQFKPFVAKSLYKNFCKQNGNTFDYSAGWGGRLLGAMASDVNYYGTDPLTYKDLTDMKNFITNNVYDEKTNTLECKIFNNCSEDESLYKNLPEMDFIFSSPPYFNLEIYSNDTTQSYIQFDNYNEWLIRYWDKTVKNCISILKEDGYFGVAMVDKLLKYNIGKDVTNVCKSNNLILKKTITMNTAKSHLSGKKSSKISMKNTDVIYIFTKK